MDRIEFIAVIPETGKPIKIAGDPMEGGSVTLDLPGTEFPKLLGLAAFARGKRLRFVVDEDTVK